MQKNKISSLIRATDVFMETVWILMVFSLPLLFFPNIFTTFELTKVVVFKGAVTLLFLLWILKYFLGGAVPMFDGKYLKYVWIFLGGFLGFYLLATLLSVAPALSVFGWYPRFQGLTTFAGYAVFGVVVFFELRTPQQKDRLILALMSGLLLTCLVALLQKFMPGFLQWWNDAEFNGRIYGTMANPNYLAAYIVMIVPLLLSNLFRKKWRVFSVLCLIAGVSALLFTLSREGFLALFLSVLFFFIVIAHQRRAKKTLVALAVLPFIVGGLVWFLNTHQQDPWVHNNPFLVRLTTSEENVSSARSRLEIWPAVMRQIAVSPMIGFGPETFAVSFPSFAPDSVNTREDAGAIVDHAHNELLDIAVQIGVPGTVAYFCFLLGIVTIGTRLFLKKRGQDADAWTVFAMSTGVLGLFIANEFGFSVTVHWVLLSLFSAVTLNTMGQKDFTMVPYRLHFLVKGGVFALILILSAGMFWMYDIGMVMADAHMRQGYEAIVAGDFETTAREYELASEGAPVEQFYALNLAYAQLQRVYDGQKLSSMEAARAFYSALHASRLRGYDGFSLSVGQELQKAF